MSNVKKSGKGTAGDWEKVPAGLAEQAPGDVTNQLVRLKVPEGWLVAHRSNGTYGALVYVPDKYHKWEV